MAVIDNAIRIEEDNSLSFGNYSVADKQKVNDFEVAGNIYKMKTHKEVTRFEKNGKLLIETVPGSTVHNFKTSEKHTSFSIEGFENTQITLELEPETNYKIIVSDFVIGMVKTNLSGKVNFSLELNSNEQEVKIEKN